MTETLRKIKRYEKLLEENRYVKETPIEKLRVADAGYKTSNYPPPECDFRDMEQGAEWGSGNDSHAWFVFTVSDVGKDTYLKIKTDKECGDSTNPQFLVYCNGEIRQGADVNHTEVRLEEGVTTEVWLYGYTGPQVSSARLFVSTVVRNPVIYALYYDILYPLQMLEYLNPESGEYAEIVQYLYVAVSMLNLIDADGLTASAKDAHDYMERAFYRDYCRKQNATVLCIGHTHIDCAWLWTLRQTREKVQRSFATVLELMKRYPEYRFMSSQPLLYQNLKEEAPDLYEAVRKRVREGRWEPEGAMWVEADCNLTSGESLVRQVLYGKRFFLEEFGVNSHVLWLPDVFGYSAALPQILRKSGVDWFVTSKISWNDTNRMPYDTFLWKGIDGTAIHTYFLTAQNDDGQPSKARTTYVGQTNAQMLSGTYRRYQQKSLSREVLLTFGFGDGGGGPTVEHLELIRRAAHGVPGSPNAEIGFVGAYLDRLKQKIDGNSQLPVWQGELYLEFHRGTYTAQANNKKNNRRGELLYQNAELLATLNYALLGTEFPQDDLQRGWKILLTNQFHDIIPGSSIREVYEQSDIDYAETFSIGNRIVSEARERIAAAVDNASGYVVFNPHSFRTAGLVQINGKTAITPPTAPKGYTVTTQFRMSNHIRITGRTVETDRYTVTFDTAWQICSLYDKANDREVIKPGCTGNELRIYADYPDRYDAWEWQGYSRDSYRTVTAVASADMVEDGVRKGIRIVRPFGNSMIAQTVWFYDDFGKIDFETTVNWHERHKMLKVAFPVDVQSDKATFEIQFGTIERPTHFNTEWDHAKFETCAQKYADLSDGGYGVSILNDCKYGHDIHDGVIQLSLLRAPTNPDSEADQGLHTFTYAISPHSGTLCESDTVKLAYYLNQPMIAIPATGTKNVIPVDYSAVECDCSNIICETVKEAEDGNGIILRFYECANKRTKGIIRIGFCAKKVFLCDLMENALEELSLENGSFCYTFGNFEIATVRLI